MAVRPVAEVFSGRSSDCRRRSQDSRVRHGRSTTTSVLTLAFNMRSLRPRWTPWSSAWHSISHFARWGLRRATV